MHTDNYDQKLRASGTGSENGPAALVGDERGIALVLTLSMLAILSVIGAYALSSTNTDLRVTSNFRQSRQALSATERVINYAQGYVRTEAGDAMILNTPVNLDTGGTLIDLTVEDGSGNPIDGEMDTTQDNTLTRIMEGAAPKGMGIDKLSGEYYRVDVTGKASRDNAVRARVDMVFFSAQSVDLSGTTGSGPPDEHGAEKGGDDSVATEEVHYL